METNLLSSEELVQTILSVVGDSISQSDSISWGTVLRSSGSESSKRYSITPISDPTQIISGLINQTGFDLQPKDVVLIYKIQNQWSNALIVAKKNISFEEDTSSISSSTEQKEERVLEPNSTERNLYYYGQSDGFSTFIAQPANGQLCDTDVDLVDFEITVSAQWNYGQPFDGGLIYNNISQWLNWSGGGSKALIELKNAHDSVGLDETPIIYMTRALYNSNDGGPTGIFNFISDKVSDGDVLLVARKSPFDTILDETKNFRVLNVLSTYTELESSTQ